MVEHYSEKEALDFPGAPVTWYIAEVSWMRRLYFQTSNNSYATRPNSDSRASRAWPILPSQVDWHGDRPSKLFSTDKA